MILTQPNSAPELRRRLGDGSGAELSARSTRTSSSRPRSIPHPDPRRAAPPEPAWPSSTTRRTEPGAIISLDPNSAVKALVGGIDYASRSSATPSPPKRQPVPPSKPFVYLTAMEHGLTPDTVRDDAPSPQRAGPKNYEGIPWAGDAEGRFRPFDQHRRRQAHRGRPEERRRDGDALGITSPLMMAAPRSRSAPRVVTRSRSPAPMFLRQRRRGRGATSSPPSAAPTADSLQAQRAHRHQPRHRARARCRMNRVARRDAGDRRGRKGSNPPAGPAI